MMRRSKNLLGSGEQEYFNEKRPVNVRVDDTAHLAQHTSPNSSRAPGDADEYPAITVVLSECRQAGSNSAVGFTGITSP